MIRVAYFGPDVHDAAVPRRVVSLQEDGFHVEGFTMRRGQPADTDWPNTDLGETRDGAFMQRIAAVFRGAQLAADTEAFQTCDVIMARNFDMLICAFEAKRRAGLDTPVIYECRDIHRLLSRTDAAGVAMRRLERSLLRRCSALMVSSPGFLKHHYAVHHEGLYDAVLVENRMSGAMELGDRPSPSVRDAEKPLLIGWAGKLRCKRSHRLLAALADRFPSGVEIHAHGIPALNEIPEFHSEIDKRRNFTFHGSYTSPDDLAGIYAGMDVVWAGDFMEADGNSDWLLPNRLYEGGYYGTPPIAPDGTETAAWVKDRNCGFTPGEALENTLPALVERLLRDGRLIDEKEARLLALPASVFVETRGEMAALIEKALLNNRAGATGDAVDTPTTAA